MEAQTLNPTPTPTQPDPPLKQLWNSLRSKNSRFTRPYEDFAQDMQNENARRQLHQSLQRMDPAFNRTFEEFSMDLLGDPQKKKTQPTPTEPLAESQPSPEPLVQESLPSTSSPQPDPTQSVISSNFDDVALAKLAKIDPKDIVGSAGASPEDTRARFERQRAEEAEMRDFITGKDKEKAMAPPGFADDPAGGIMNAIGHFNQAVVRGTAAIPKEIGILANELDGIFGTGPKDKEVEDYATYKGGQWLEDKALQWGIGVTDPRYGESFMLSDVPQGLGSVFQMALFGGRGLFGRGAKLASQTTSQVAATVQGAKDVGRSLTSRASFAGSTAMAVPEFDAAKKAGLSDEDAFVVWLKNYGLGSTEALPVANAFARLNKIGGAGKFMDFLRNGTVGGLEEGVQEFVQTTMSNQIAQGSYDPKRDLFQDVLRSAGAGFFVGFILPGIGMAMQQMTPEDRQATQEELNKTLRNFKQKGPLKPKTDETQSTPAREQADEQKEVSQSDAKKAGAPSKPTGKSVKDQTESEGPSVPDSDGGGLQQSGEATTTDGKDSGVPSQEPPAEDVSAEQSFSDGRKKFKVIGKNSSGETIGEDDNGVRARLTGEKQNVIVTQPVNIVPGHAPFADAPSGEFLTDEEEMALKANEGTDDDKEKFGDQPNVIVGKVPPADNWKHIGRIGEVGDIVKNENGDEFKIVSTVFVKNADGNGTTPIYNIQGEDGQLYKITGDADFYIKPKSDETTTPQQPGTTVQSTEVSEDTAQEGPSEQAPQEPAEEVQATEQPRDADGGSSDPGGQYIADVEPRLGIEDLNKIGLRKIAQNYGITDDRQIKELTEVAITNRARALAKEENAYEKLVDLYQKQPTLAHRTSESIAKQQYSTPIPIAYLAGKYINADKVSSVLEPSAGNGMLTIVADPSKVTVNEIDDIRNQNLGRQKFAQVLKQDGTKPFGMDRQFDAVITNPPFGGTKATTIDGYKFNELAQIMSVRALEAMKDNGKAAIIIGGNNDYDEKGRLIGRDRIYFNYLYSHYNVDDVVDISGDLYRKQGASFPIRLILINGRKPTPGGVAPLKAEFGPKVKDFAALEERVSKLFSEPNIQADEDLQSTELDRGTSADPRSGIARVEGQTSATSAPGTTQGEVSHTSGESDSGGIEAGTDRGGSIGSQPAVGRPAGDSGIDPDFGSIPQRDVEPGREPGDVDSRPADATPDVQRDRPRTNRKAVAGALSEQSGSVDYQPTSKGRSMNVKIPSSMAQEMYDAITRVREEVGDLDAYVRQKLHYKSNKELYDALGAEQIDGVAMAIWNIENGDALIIGDQTGIGKGRQAAAIIRYGNYNGYKPIFMTEKANLFGAIYRDLKAIGHGNIKPFMVNNIGDKFNGVRDKDEGGTVIHKAYPSGHPEHKKALQNLKIPDDAQVVLATYSQFGNPNYHEKINFIKAVAKGNIIILDESHNASGKESNTGAVFQEIIPQAKGVVYLSGTYAKRPDNMPVYAMKTAMKEANMERDDLIAAIENGGVALQEIVSGQLAESGQIVRRQRSLEDISVTNNVLQAQAEDHRKAADTVTDLIREIIQFQRKYVKGYVSNLDKEIAKLGKQAEGRKGTSDAGVDNYPYFSKVFNIIDQMLYSLKAKETANEAIRLLKENKKPFIAIRGTLESALNDLIDTGDVNYGDTVDADFSYLLRKGLDGVLRITIKMPNGERKHETINPVSLGPTAVQEYNRIKDKISSSVSGLSISPIDELVQTIEAAGYSVGEVTGRQTKLRLSSGKKKVGVLERKRREPVDKAYIKFNSGEYDVLVVNSSGSTGEDAHADAKFKDKRVRVELVLQPELNINTLVQILGRVNRTGQVVKPEYQFINSVIPAEQRLMAMTMRKLKSLDANTTSNQKQSKGILDVPEFFNKYGDQIVIEYLKENPDVIEMIDDPLRMLEAEDLEPTKPKDAAMRVSGRIAILPVKEQERFYSEVIDRYQKQLEYLNDAGINDLEVTSLPLEAKTLSREVTIMGKGGKSAFGDNTYLEEVEVNVLRKPMTRAEIDEQIVRLAQGRDPKDFIGHIFEQLQRYQENLSMMLEQEAAKALEEDIADIHEKAQGKLSEDRIEEHIDAAKSSSAARLEKRKRTEMARLDYVKSLLRFFTPGRAVRVPTSLKLTGDASSVFYSEGIFMGFDIDLSKPKPFLPSNIRLRFAVNDGRVAIPIPASKTNEINYIRSAAYEIAPERQRQIQDWDNLKKPKGRQKRMMVTGNLLQALSKYDGKIIKYTTEDGFVQTGILLPEGYDPKEADEAQTVAIPASKAVEIVRNSSRYTEFSLNADGSVRLINNGGYFSLRVPLSKSSGGKYYLDQDLCDLVDRNNFNSVGKEMEATFSSDRLAMVLDIMQTKFGASINLQKKDFNKALADQTIEMTKRSEGTFENVAQLSLFPWLTPSKIKKKPVNQVELDALRKEIELKNADAEERYRAASGPTPSGETSTQIERVAEAFKDMIVGFRSHFKFISQNRFPRETSILRVFETIKNSTTEQAKQYMRGLVEPLTKEQYDIFTRRIVLEDLLGGIEKELEKEDALPFGFKSKKEIEVEIEKYTKLMEKEPAAQEAYDRRQAYMDTLHQALVDKKILGPDSDRKTYYHRRVLEYLKGDNVGSTKIHGKRLSKAYRDWRRARTGTKGKDYSTNFIESEYRVVSEGLYELEKQRILEELMYPYESMLNAIKKNFNKEFQQRVEDAENQFGKGSDEVEILKANKRAMMRTYIEEHIPEGYVWYQPTPGNILFKKSLISAAEVEKAVMQAAINDQTGIGVAMQLIDNIINMADPYLVVGQKNKEYLVPEPLANQLEYMGTSVEPDANVVQAMTSIWKVYVLLNPNGFVRYNLNNFVGDADGILAADPSIFKKVKQAWKELREFQRSGRSTPELNEAIRQNVIDSGWEISELADINKVDWVKLFSDQRGPDIQQAFGRKAVRELRYILFTKPGEFFRAYWDWAKKWTRIRENVFRYAAYLRAKEKIDNGETFYWASDAGQIDGITQAEYKAGKLAREVLGDYGNISVTGTRIRRWMVPFYSWMEINMGRYYRLLRNASSPKVQACIIGVAAKRGITKVAFRMMYSYAALGMLTALIEAWNWLRFPEEAEKLHRANVRGMQFILSEADDGKVVVVPIVGALYDAMEFFGLPDMKDDLALIFSGEAPKKGVLGAGKRFLISPFHRVVQAVNPFLKSGLELITGQQYFPDPGNPRPIYDYGEYAAQFFSLQDEYRALTGTPTRSPYFFGHMRNLVVRDLDPDELSYYMARRVIEQYKGDRPYSQPANAQARAKSEALYRYGLAVRFGKMDEAERYLNEYYANGGTPSSLMTSLRSKNPLGQLTNAERYDVEQMINNPTFQPQTAFGKTLTSKELAIFEDALNYYRRTYDVTKIPVNPNQ